MASSSLIGATPQHKYGEEDKPKILAPFSNNSVHFNLKASGWVFKEVSFNVKHFYIPADQNKDGHLKVGNVPATLNDKGTTATLTWNVGRHGTKAVADSWMIYLKSGQNTFADYPNELNFAIFGDLTLVLSNVNLDINFKIFTIPGVGLSQGHHGSINNWWFGGNTFIYSADRKNSNVVQTSVVDTSGSTDVSLVAKRGDNGNDDVDIISITKAKEATFDA